mmetsp:Transcript_15907/g.40405  ORF Transcript_15907/g.40405 Transcript_15907/m.40405 type:complete len:168 (-) Transcript_15907:10-513(-)
MLLGWLGLSSSSAQMLWSCVRGCVGHMRVWASKRVLCAGCHLRAPACACHTECYGGFRNSCALPARADDLALCFGFPRGSTACVEMGEDVVNWAVGSSSDRGKRLWSFWSLRCTHVSSTEESYFVFCTPESPSARLQYMPCFGCSSGTTVCRIAAEVELQTPFPCTQ